MLLPHLMDCELFLFLNQEKDMHVLSVPRCKLFLVMF